MGKTSIEWTERTWNPTTGCDRVSAGCDHCYALARARMNKAAGSPAYQNDGHPLTSGPGFALTLQPDRLEQPLHWRQPSMVFVNSMSDLFHDAVPIAFLRRVFDIMERCERHTFQILTKRATRLQRIAHELPWPPNVWMGVSVEDQAQVQRRAARLLTVPAAVRWLSVEPMIGPVDLGGLLDYGWCPVHGFDWHECRGPNPLDWRDRGCEQQRLGWVVIGGESGHGARPFDPKWARDLIERCRGAGVPVFMKQMGAEWARSHVAYKGNKRDVKGGHMLTWPKDLRVREWPVRPAEGALIES